jgi:hypothetical protein
MANQPPGNANAANQNGAPNPNAYPQYSSMSTLASAAHAYGQQPHAQQTPTTYSELDLYNVLADSNAVSYGHYDDGSAIGNFNDWYGPAAVNNFPEMLDSYGNPQVDQTHPDGRQDLNGLHGSGQPRSVPQPTRSARPAPISTQIAPKPANNSPGSSVSASSVPETPLPRTRADFRPKTSIPTDLTGEEYGRQCIIAATSSRLNPFALHPDEYDLLKDHLTRLQVTSYLNIRNGILRLWKRNPLVCVTREEAAGCAKDYRWFDLADAAYDWLVRRGYINFGCVEVPSSSTGSGKKRKTIAVIGAGMSGLGCARQLEGLFAQFSDKWHALDEEPPAVVVLEGRNRLGGRVYSHPLQNQTGSTLAPHLRSTADLGGSIITGFDNGNPLSAIVKGQLCLNYHSLKDNSVLYDIDGSPVEKDQDRRAEQLFNDILDRASVYRYRTPPKPTAEGDRDLIEAGKDPTGDGGKVLSSRADPSDAKQDSDPVMASGVDKLTGRVHTEHINLQRSAAATAASSMGWTLKDGVPLNHDLALDDAAKAPFASLGGVMATAVSQYQSMAMLDARALRLVNWHFANMEYANASNVSKLSLGSWDQDAGNEFEGEHTSIIGGYLQVPRGIWSYPTKLDLRTRHAISKIQYSPEGEGATITTASGEEFIVDEVVLTVPLGVLKAQSISFEPPLPDWKQGAISRLGFGLLNKVCSHL